MSRGAATFRQRDVTAAVRAVKAAGIGIARIEVDRDGKIIVIPGTPPRAADAPQAPEPDLGL